MSCGEGNPGIDPPNDEMNFPSGLLLDPRISDAPTGPCETDADCGANQLCGASQCHDRARWLLISNAGSDRTYNAGSMLVVDLEAFWEAAFAHPEQVLDAGSRLSTDAPCRRIANRPQAVECMEQPFVRDETTIHFGLFPGPAAAWDRDPADDEALIMVPVRGDPSITTITLSGGLGGSDDVRLECGQAGDADGGRYCDDDHRLRFLRNDPDAARLSREPFRIHVSQQEDIPLAYITHQNDADLTLLALEGLAVGGDGRPAIVDQSNVFAVTGGYQGGFGVAARPCDLDGNAPVSTLGCTRPLVYGTMRWQVPAAVQVFTAVDVEPLPGSQQQCVGPDELDQLGAIICEPQVRSVIRFGVGGLPASTNSLVPRLADLAFSADGDELYVLQVNPGALIRVDTSLGVDGDPINSAVGLVEVCSQPTTMHIYADGENSYALVTCYRSADVFIVDLTSFTVAGLARAGIGPDQLEFDYAREVVYVANSLDATVSVIDMARQSPTRFTEIGHLGLSEPYSQ